mmetsp:Transcript_21896/g.32588  ORF Transcript_21896/g.32588 Transcript_21896/m.32588 type:complete len:201 (+) Transcript_21896:1750-2352(+)
MPPCQNRRIRCYQKHGQDYKNVGMLKKPRNEQKKRSDGWKRNNDVRWKKKRNDWRTKNVVARPRLLRKHERRKPRRLLISRHAEPRKQHNSRPRRNVKQPSSRLRKNARLRKPRRERIKRRQTCWQRRNGWKQKNEHSENGWQLKNDLVLNERQNCCVFNKRRNSSYVNWKPCERQKYKRPHMQNDCVVPSFVTFLSFMS